MAEENGTPSNDFNKFKSNVVHVVSKDPRRSSFCLCKIIETILCAITLGLASYPMEDFRIRRSLINEFTIVEEAIVFTTLAGFIMINVVLSVSQLLREQLPTKMLMIFSSLGALLCCITGGMLILKPNSDMNAINYRNSYYEMNLMTPSGVMALFAAFTFALDTFFTYKYSSK